jgi:hypothetical protein
LKTALRKSLPGLETSFRRVIILAILYCFVALQAMVFLPGNDPDIWWHLRTGQWILAHGQVPTTDPFSSYGMGKPWVAYSWLFEILVYGLYRHLGLFGILLFTVAMSLLVGLSVHILIQQAKFPFVLEVFLVAATLAGMKPLMTPRPWLISILCFALQLLILRHAKFTRKPAIIWLLPLLYGIWANFHIQFVYGLVVIFFLVMEGLILTIVGCELPSEESQRIPARSLLLVGAACVLATLANPYGYNVYRQVIEYGLQTEAFQLIQELQSLSFRSPADWMVVMLTVAASFVLGLKRRLLPFPMLLLLLGCFLGFRARRDVWVTLLAAAFIISEHLIVSCPPDAFQLTRGRVLALLGGIAIGVGMIGWYRQLSEPHLRTAVERRFPVKAVEFVRQNNYGGPLFNTFGWGGYLIWSLREIPVSIDGRANIHGHRVASVRQTWMGYLGWDSDRELMDSQIVIADIGWPLTSLLRMDSRFKLVYEDGTAAVFVRNPAKS